MLPTSSLPLRRRGSEILARKSRWNTVLRNHYQLGYSLQSRELMRPILKYNSCGPRRNKGGSLGSVREGCTSITRKGWFLAGNQHVKDPVATAVVGKRP